MHCLQTSEQVARTVTSLLSENCNEIILVAVVIQLIETPPPLLKHPNAFFTARQP
jgi:hypothetical protein